MFLVFVGAVLQGHRSNAQLRFSYKPPFLPFSATVNTKGEITFSGDTSLVTPLGTFGAGVDYRARDGDGNSTVVVVRRNNRDSVYNVRTGDKQLVVAAHGHMRVIVRDRYVLLDISEDEEVNIRFLLRSSTAIHGRWIVLQYRLLRNSRHAYDRGIHDEGVWIFEPGGEFSDYTITRVGQVSKGFLESYSFDGGVLSIGNRNYRNTYSLVWETDDRCRLMQSDKYRKTGDGHRLDWTNTGDLVFFVLHRIRDNTARLGADITSDQVEQVAMKDYSLRRAFVESWLEDK
jgi:hypothetical protein